MISMWVKIADMSRKKDWGTDKELYIAL